MSKRFQCKTDIVLLDQLSYKMSPCIQVFIPMSFINYWIWPIKIDYRLSLPLENLVFWLFTLCKFHVERVEYMHMNFGNWRVSVDNCSIITINWWCPFNHHKLVSSTCMLITLPSFYGTSVTKVTMFSLAKIVKTSTPWANAFSADIRYHIYSSPSLKFFTFPVFLKLMAYSICTLRQNDQSHDLSLIFNACQ